VIDLRAAAYTIPTDAPEADGTLSWTATTMILVEAQAEGLTGIGWTYGPPAVASVVTGQLAPAAGEAGVHDVPSAHERMCRAVRNAGRPGVCAMAISAVDCALWDLRARTLGLPLHHLLGAARREVPVYGSGGFTTYDSARTREQLTYWTKELGIPRVKIKVGESWGGEQARDLARLSLAREAIGDGVDLYADANGAYSVKQAIAVGTAAADVNLRWFEEPVSSDDLAGLRAVREVVPSEVAAGEYAYDLPGFARILDAVDCPQADVTRIGGITEFLRAAALARAHGRELSAHCAPHLHAAAMTAIPNARHIEWFHDHARIESMLFDGALTPDGGALRLRDDTPGLGLQFKHQDADPYRVE
jgi:L-alanine-DL-glutamate epimerase-like enolase superfamily enzyme